MKKAVDLLRNISTTIFSKTYNNNMIMIYSKDYSVENMESILNQFFSQRTNNYQKLVSLSLKDVCMLFKLNNILLGKLLVDELVKQGVLCLDEGDLEISYFPNMFFKK